MEFGRRIDRPGRKPWTRRCSLSILLTTGMCRSMFITTYTEMLIAMTRQLKLVQPTKPRLGLYVRPGRNDHTTILQLLAEDRAVSGLVLDARHAGRHRALREALVDNGVHAVLDPNLMEAATPGGRMMAGLTDVPWVAYADTSPEDLKGRAGAALAELIADAVHAGEFSAVLAPTHLIESAGDPYFAADRVVAGYLRRALDRRGLLDCCVFYPLAMPAAALRSSVQRTLLIDGLRSVDVDAVWLRLHPFGTSSAGSISLRRYLDAAWELHAVEKPIVGERTGTVGLALMAYGGIGGIESGVTLGERFDAGALTSPRADTKAFSPAPRVYIDGIGAFADRRLAQRVFQNRQLLAALACRDATCCRGGAAATLRDPRRHFLIRRREEVESLGAVAPAARATVYLHDMLQPAALLAVRVARVAPELERAQRRLDGWHQTLDAIGTSGLPVARPALGYRFDVARPKPQSL